MRVTGKSKTLIGVKDKLGWGYRIQKTLLCRIFFSPFDRISAEMFKIKDERKTLIGVKLTSQDGDEKIRPW